MSTNAPSMYAAFLLASLLLLANPPRGNALDLQGEIDPLAKQLLADEVAVGLVVGIYQDGETQVIGYGETEKGNDIAPDGDTIYEIGSASKVFTGALLADLVRRGRVKLDDPMQKHLPQAAKTQLKNPSHITFEHLATHTSGLPVLPDNIEPADLMNPYADYTYQQVFAFLKDHEPRRAPGEYEYSNFGMGLLGVLLASRERMSYEKLLVEHIAKPCGMDDTCVKLSSEQRRRLAPPYGPDLQPSKNWDIPTLTGAGGIRSTTKDMLKFVVANLANDNKPLAKTFQLSHRKRHTLPDGQAIGLAWHIADDGITCWHNGMTGGYASWLAVVPSQNVGVVVLSNTATMEITVFGEKVTRIALGEEVEPRQDPVVVEVAREVLKSYEGAYAITPEFVLTVRLEGDQLTVQATGQQKLQVYPESETRFSVKGIDAQLTFAGDKDGKAEMVILHQNGANQVATRQD